MQKCVDEQTRSPSQFLCPTLADARVHLPTRSPLHAIVPMLKLDDTKYVIIGASKQKLNEYRYCMPLLRT